MNTTDPRAFLDAATTLATHAQDTAAVAEGSARAWFDRSLAHDPMPGITWDDLTPDESEQMTTPARWVIEAAGVPDLAARLQQTTTALQEVLKALDDEPLMVGMIRADIARTPGMRGGSVIHEPGTPGWGRGGCPGDNVTEWFDDLRAAVVSALDGGDL